MAGPFTADFAVEPLSSKQLGRLLADLRSELEILYGPRLVRSVLFGSYARGAAGSESDVDVLTVLTDPVDPMLEIERTGALVGRLLSEHGKLVGLLAVGKLLYDTGGWSLVENVREEGIEF